MLKIQPALFSCNPRAKPFVFLVAQCEFVVSRYMRITRSTVFVSATVALLLFCLILPGSSQAQGIDGLSQLLGGGLGLTRNSGQSSAPITVQRNDPPYTGMFNG